jgi:hypothetical protein
MYKKSWTPMVLWVYGWLLVENQVGERNIQNDKDFKNFFMRIYL